MDKPKQILLVEDEPLIAMMLEDFVDMLGLSVAGVADSVEDALARLAAGGVDAAILDVHLRGGETCWPVADALAGAGIPFILATGGGGDMIDRAHQGRPVLAKPFTMESVDKALAKLALPVDR